MQVWAGGLTALSHSGDLLTGIDMLADRHHRLVDVSVDGDQPVVVLNAYPESESTRGTGADHRSGENRVDRCTRAVGDVDTVMDSSPTGTVGGSEFSCCRLDNTVRP